MTEQLMSVRKVKPTITVTKQKSARGRRIIGYIASFCGWGMGGTTPQNAVDQLVNQLLNAHNGSYTPKILEYRGWVKLLVRDPVYGWGSRYIKTPTSELETGMIFMSSGNYVDYKRFEEACLYDIAQNGWIRGEPVPDIVPERMRKEFESWMEFQNRYRYAKDKLGYGDNDAHDYAGRNPMRLEIWRDK